MILLFSMCQSLYVAVNKCIMRIVELELFELDMSLNTKKSVCIRFGPRYQSPCCSLKSIKGDDIFGWPLSWYVAEGQQTV